MTGRWYGLGAGFLAATLIFAGIGCGGDEAAPPTTTVASSTTTAPVAPPTTAPSPSTVPSAAADPTKPRALPAVDVAEGGDLIAFSNWRWKDRTQQQIAADVRLLRGPIAAVWYTFHGQDKIVATGMLPGNTVTGKNEGAVVYLPAPIGSLAGGTTRLEVRVIGLPQDAMLSGQPQWVGPVAMACEQGSAADCQMLATAYRTGTSDKGAVEKNAALAKRFSERFVEIGQLGCAVGPAENCLLMGQAYLTGTDVPVDRNLAIALLQKACAQGVHAACDLQARNRAVPQSQRH